MAQLNVLTINLRHEAAEDGHDNWPYRKKRTVRLIQETAPAIFGTQEGRKPQVQDFSSLLQDYTLCDRHRYWDPARFYPSIFFRNDFLQILESGDRWLSETPHIHASKSWGSAFPRLATWAKCRIISDRTSFLFVDVHLDHVGAEARAGQAQALLELLLELDTNPLPVVIVSDFNDVPGSEPYRILTREYKDAWKERCSSERETDTWHGFTGKGQRGRLDWILVSRGVSILDVEILRTSYGGSYPSDHFPVRAMLDV